MLIYTHTNTKRLMYTVDLIFGSVLKMDYRITEDVEEYQNSRLPKMAYTNIDQGSGMFLKSSLVLFETTINKEVYKKPDRYLGFPVFFQTDAASCLPYDLFATVFYFATRYEEYGNHDVDKHHRFKAENSLAYRYQCLTKPFLNYLIADFAHKITQQYEHLVIKPRAFNYLSTIDIDNAYAYAHKGFIRNMGGLLKDASLFKMKRVYQRVVSNFNPALDPYNTFEFIHALSRTTQTNLHYFVLIGDHSQFDKNPHHTNRGFRQLLKTLSSQFPMGLHPSYDSFEHLEKINLEKQRLEQVIDKKITSARCHFLRVMLPETYRTFIRLGITDDYTMMYASQSGFRTGLCTPYKWFDLEHNEMTNLTLHTSVVMEGTLRDYNQLNAEQAKQISISLLEEVKKQGGEFISIFHNDSFIAEQTDWVEVYKTILEKSIT